MNSAPEIARVRHEVKRRELTVARVERLVPTMVRVALCGAALEGFTSLGFDDHVKLFFPAGVTADEVAPGQAPPMRDFTPRRYDAEAGELWIDFFLHEAGPAASWAAQVAVGQTLTVGGPRGSAVISTEGIDSHLLIGDETALPAMGRRLEELPAGTRALVVIETDAGAAGYPFENRSAADYVWIPRSPLAGAPGGNLIAALQTLKFPPGRCFAWAALEMQAVRAVRRHLVDERQFDKHWVKAAAYWQRDAAGVHEVIRDEE
jgi:NADPH-dependent ferric siderophore reductase